MVDQCGLYTCKFLKGSKIILFLGGWNLLNSYDGGGGGVNFLVICIGCKLHYILVLCFGVQIPCILILFLYYSFAFSLFFCLQNFEKKKKEKLLKIKESPGRYNV